MVVGDGNGGKLSWFVEDGRGREGVLRVMIEEGF